MRGLLAWQEEDPDLWEPFVQHLRKVHLWTTVKQRLQCAVDGKKVYTGRAMSLVEASQPKRKRKKQEGGEDKLKQMQV